MDDGHTPSRHRVAPLRRAQGCLQTRAPLALPSTAMQPAPSASSMPALTGATVDAVERGHAASPCLQGAGGYLRPSAAPQWARALGATVASPRRQSLPALPADSCTQPWEQACVQGPWTGDADTECSVAQSVGGGLQSDQCRFRETGLRPGAQPRVSSFQSASHSKTTLWTRQSDAYGA